jgi:hypothetical protein
MQSQMEELLGFWSGCILFDSNAYHPLTDSSVPRWSQLLPHTQQPHPLSTLQHGEFLWSDNN